MREKGKKVMCFVLGLFMMVFMLQTNVDAAPKIKLNKTKTTIYAGQTETLNLTGAKAKKWTSDNKKVATVTSKGVVKAKAKGTAKITCQATNGKKYTCKVTVKEPYLITNGFRIDVGKSMSLRIIGTTAKKWTSSNKKVATVKPDKTYSGRITTHKKGKTTITCYGANGKKYTCKVTVI